MHVADIRRVTVGDLDQRPSAEIDAEIEAPGGKEEHRQHERDQRDHVEHERVLHERDDARDSEEFHVYSLWSRQFYLLAVIPAKPAPAGRKPGAGSSGVGLFRRMNVAGSPLARDDRLRGYAAFTVGFHTCPIDIFSSFLRPP